MATNSEQEKALAMLKDACRKFPVEMYLFSRCCHGIGDEDAAWEFLSWMKDRFPSFPRNIKLIAKWYPTPIYVIDEEVPDVDDRDVARWLRLTDVLGFFHDVVTVPNSRGYSMEEEHNIPEVLKSMYVECLAFVVDRFEEENSERKIMSKSSLHIG